MPKTNETRATEVNELAKSFRKAVAAATKEPDNQALWLEVATLAGNIQRRSRLLAGLGRGG